MAWARWHIVNHGKDSKFVFSGKLLKNYKQKSDISFTLKKKNNQCALFCSVKNRFGGRSKHGSKRNQGGT